MRAVVELQVEALAPGLEQVRAVAAAQRRARPRGRARRRRRSSRGRGRRSRARRLLALATAIPRSSASDGALTRLTSSSTWPAQHAHQHGEREQARVALGDAAEVLDLDALDDEPSASAIASRPSRSTSGTNGPSTSWSSARDRRDVDRGRDDAAGQRGDDLLGGLHAGAVLRLGGRGAEVRRDDDVRIARTAGAR